MLSDSEQLLIAAAVDGHLTREQAMAARRLFAAKPDAAELYRRLKADAERVRTLAVRKAPSQLRAAVMARVTALPTAHPRRRPRRVVWAPYVLAASVLFAVAAGSFLFFRSNTPLNERAMRVQLPAEPPHAGEQIGGEDTDASGVVKAGSSGAEAGVVKATPIDDVFASGAKPGPEPELIPSPRAVVADAPPVEPKDVFTVGEWIASKPLTAAELRLPTLVSGTEFHQVDVAATIRKEFEQDAAVRVDLFSKNPVAALEHFQAVARASKVSVFVDFATSERMRKVNGFTFALYLENLSPAELTTLFAALSRQVNASSKPDGVLGTAHFIPTGAIEAKDVRELIGTDLAVAKSMPKPEEPKSIASGTLPMVTAAVKKSGERAAVVITYLPVNARVGAAKSSEVKQFLDKRGDRKPGTVPVLVVFRP